MAKRWTDNQIRAILARDRDVCVAAGAGSGKTGVLVERFVRIVKDSIAKELPPDRSATVEQILVITFTEKATKEMKGRIVEELTSAGLREQRRMVETAYISTIHGFCSRLLQENPFEAGVDPEFKVLEETDARQMFSDAFENVIERAYAENDTALIELVAAAQDERVFGTDIRDPLAALAEAVERVLNRLRGAGRTLDELQSHIDAGQQLTSASLRTPVLNLLNVIIREVLSAKQELQMMSGGLFGALEAIRRTIVDQGDNLRELDDRDGWERICFVTALLKEIGQHSAKGRRVRAGASQQEMDAQSIVERLRITCDTAKLMHDLVADQEQRADELCYWFWQLVVKAWREYRDAKRSQGVLDNEDLQSEAVALLSSFPTVLNRYQQLFRYIMVDEFQDTNPLQMRLIDLLKANSANGDGPNLFIVGDVQQSIYGFRNADASIFQDIVRRYGREGDGEYVSLADNFRSRPELLAFANQLFGQLWRSGRTTFMPLAHGAEHTDKQIPSVELLLSKGVMRSQYHYAEATAIAQRVKELMADPAMAITDKRSPRCGKPISYGDVAVLLRSLNDIEKYEQAFIRAGIPYFVVGGGRGYYARYEVRDIMNVLTVLDTPLNDTALLATLRSPMVGLDVDTLYALALRARNTDETPGYLYYAIKPLLEEGALSESEAGKLRAFTELMDTLRAQEDRLPVGELLERIIEQTQYGAKLLMRPGGKRRLANVRKLLQMAHGAATHGVGGFIRRLRDVEKLSDREGDAPTEEEAADVVHLITIHKAKGLEFPVVFLADMARGLTVMERSLFVCEPNNMVLGCKLNDYQTGAYRVLATERRERDLAESLRVLYVALTRAREHLVLCGGLQARKRSDNWADMALPLLGVLSAPEQPEIRTLVGGVAASIAPIIDPNL